MDHPLKQYREKEGITQEQLAERVGVSRGLVSLIETGERRIAAEDVAEWARLTGIPREKLRPDIFGKAAA